MAIGAILQLFFPRSASKQFTQRRAQKPLKCIQKRAAAERQNVSRPERPYLPHQVHSSRSTVRAESETRPQPGPAARSNQPIRVCLQLRFVCDLFAFCLHSAERIST